MLGYLTSNNELNARWHTRYFGRLHALFWQATRVILAGYTRYFGRPHALFWRATRVILVGHVHALFWQATRVILASYTCYFGGLHALKPSVLTSFSSILSTSQVPCYNFIPALRQSFRILLLILDPVVSYYNHFCFILVGQLDANGNKHNSSFSHQSLGSHAHSSL